MKFFFLLFLLPIQLFAQQAAVSSKQLTGLWKGYFYTDEVKVPYELVFSEQNGNIIGWSYTTFTVRGAEIVTMKKVSVKQKDGIIVEDDDNLYNNFPSEQPKKIKQTNTLSLEDKTDPAKLTGTFETKTPRTLKHAKGTVFLEKKNTADSSMLIAKLSEMDLARTLSFSFNTPPAKEPDVSSLAVNEKRIPEKIIEPFISPDTIEAVKTIVLPKPTPVDVAVIFADPAKPIKTPPVKNRQAKAIVIAPVKTVAKENPAVVAAKPVPTKAAPPAVAKINKIPVPVIKKAPPAAATVKSVPPKPIPINLAVAPAIDLGKRTIEIIDQLTIASDSLQFTLYDNGDVDGDTVSIIMNGKTIVSRQGLSTNPFTKTIYLTPDMGDTVQLIMYAENLGAIPPNTGLMILNYDKQRKEVRFSGDLSKNAAITLRRKEKE